MRSAIFPNRVFASKIQGLLSLLGFLLISLIAKTAVGAVTLDATVAADQLSSAISTGPFSTAFGNELLLAFIATDYLSGPNTTVTGVSGGGLNWVLVRRTNVQSGTSEIWRAFATSTLTNTIVTATLSQNVYSSLAVMSFAGVDTTGTNGSGAIGATGTANSKRGAPSASLTTTRNGSWVIGVGNDYDYAIARTLGPNQGLVHQFLAPVGDTYWVQMQASDSCERHRGCHKRHSAHFRPIQFKHLRSARGQLGWPTDLEYIGNDRSVIGWSWHHRFLERPGDGNGHRRYFGQLLISQSIQRHVQGNAD